MELYSLRRMQANKASPLDLVQEIWQNVVCVAGGEGRGGEGRAEVRLSKELLHCTQ